jgi:hypothetical protein
MSSALRPPCWAALIALALLAATPLRAAEERRTADEPAGSTYQTQVALVFRSLFYDRSLPTVTTVPLVLGIVSGGKDKKMVAEVQAAFDLLVEKPVHGRKFKTQVLPFESAEALKKQLAGAPVAALIVADLPTSSVRDVSNASRALQRLSVGFDAELLRLGVSLVAVNTKNRPRIVVSLPNAKAEGVDFEATFLSHTEVLR